MATIALTGGTGLVGGRLLARLCTRGDHVMALTRRPEHAELPPGAKAVGWDGVAVAGNVLRRSSAIVHLAGEPIFGGPLTAKRRQRAYASRVDSTRSVVATLGGLPASERPETLVCASAVGIYADAGDEPIDEDGALGSGFLAELCQDWEAAAKAATALGVRVVSVRFGVVLAGAGGALAAMRRPFALGLGAVLGSGRQWFPWIALEDAARLLEASLDDSRFRGAVNSVAPNPVTHAEFSRELGRVLHRPVLLKVPAFALRFGLGELAPELLDSRRVVPKRALEHGFAFGHAELSSCLRAELGA